MCSSMDYRNYRLSPKEKACYSFQVLAIVAVVAFCFYDAWWPFLGWPPLTVVYLRLKRRELADRRKAELRLQFQAAVQAIAAALSAGYSAENAVGEARRDLQLMYEEELDMVQELAAIQRKLDANQTLESAFGSFAQRSDLEEAQTFAEVFAVGKRSGGDLIEIMKDTARTISEAVETERQVEAVLASRKYEQKIMNFMPVAIVLYLRFGSPGFLDLLYHNPAGICVATLCLALYALAVYLGQRLLRIEV